MAFDGTRPLLLPRRPSLHRAARTRPPPARSAARPRRRAVAAAAATAPGDDGGTVDGSGQGGRAAGAPRTPRLVIEYCPGCRWGLRAGWMAQELLITFGTAIGEVALQPSPTTGTFTITVDGVSLFCRQTNPGKGFPELGDIKRRLRDVIAPDASLGHSDGPKGGEPAADSLTA